MGDGAIPGADKFEMGPIYCLFTSTGTIDIHKIRAKGLNRMLKNSNFHRLLKKVQMPGGRNPEE